jgi:FkbM family methyltransferase
VRPAYRCVAVAVLAEREPARRGSDAAIVATMRSALARPLRSLKYKVRNCIRSAGYNVARLHPDASDEVFLMMLFRDLGINAVLDVGANTGQYGDKLRRSGYRGWIVSFEPLPAAFDKLSRRVASDPQWVARREALGDEEGTRLLHVAGGNGSTSSFLEPSELGRTLEALNGVLAASSMSDEIVRVTTLSSVFDECIATIRDPCVLLKMDTQGYDLHVLKGAEPLLPRIAAVQSEVAFQHLYEGMPDHLQTLRYFEERGFDLAGMFPILRDRIDRIIEADCVLVNTALARSTRATR